MRMLRAPSSARASCRELLSHTVAFPRLRSPVHVVSPRLRGLGVQERIPVRPRLPRGFGLGLDMEEVARARAEARGRSWSRGSPASQSLSYLVFDSPDTKCSADLPVRGMAGSSSLAPRSPMPPEPPRRGERRTTFGGDGQGEQLLRRPQRARGKGIQRPAALQVRTFHSALQG